MGVFQEHFLRRHLVLEDFPICVETGTNLGWSTKTITKIFPEVYTIEIVPRLARPGPTEF
jgi:protein-L-isoaspartate O-methyltransferase